MAIDYRRGGGGPVAIQAQVMDWNPEAAAALAQARATPDDLEQYRSQVEQGTAQLWRLTGDTDSHVLTRVEEHPNGDHELVIVAGTGNNSRQVIAWAMKLATEHELHTLRAHITRPGLQRIFEGLGWHEAERVMRIELNGQ